MSLAAEARIHPGRAEGDSPCRLDTALLQLFLNKIQKQAGSGFWSSWIAARMAKLVSGLCEKSAVKDEM